MKPSEAPAEGRDGLQMVFRSGQQAFQSGQALTKNPFIVGSKARGFWSGGWHSGKRMTARGAPATPRRRTSPSGVRRSSADHPSGVVSASRYRRSHTPSAFAPPKGTPPAARS
jgi:hypothetical protein